MTKEEEFKMILDRETPENAVKEHFAKHVELLVDMANYGSNLLSKAYNASQKKLEDIIIIAVLLKQVVSMIDAVEILISKGSVSAANMQARSAYEASLYIDWMLSSDPERKAKYYYVSNLRKERLWSLRFKPGTKEQEAFSETIRDLEPHLKTYDPKTVRTSAVDLIAKVDTILAKPEWHEINAEFEKRYRRSGVEAYWYKLLGINSIKKLARAVSRLDEYHFYYSRSSEVMYTAAYRNHVSFREGLVVFEPIRQLKDIDQLLRFITIIAISTYKSIIKHYMYNELKGYIEKYVRDWRDLFLNIPSVSYTTNLHTSEPLDS